jgi:hypothetical protein
MTLNGQLASGVALVLNLAVELGGVSDAFVPAPVQVADIRVDDVRPLQAFGDDDVRGGGANQFADGGLVQSEFPADPCLGPPLLPQFVGGSMLFTEPSHDFQLCRRLDHLRFVGSVCGFRRRFGQTGAMTVHCLLDRLAEIGPQMIAISDLLGLRRPDARTLRLTAGPVPADHLHLGVFAEPRGEVCALAPVVEMQWTMGGHVDQHRAVVTALAESEVVDAEDLHLADLGSGRALTSRSSVSLPTVMPTAEARRAPARPARVSPIRVSTSRNSGVCRLCGVVSPTICSANVTAMQAVFSQRNRRMRNSITTPSPPTATSRSSRTYRPCTRAEL